VTDRTIFDGRGRVHFRRRTEEDGWVVLYMPSLLLYINCHIHVNVCFIVIVFMYFYKYLFKGPDQTRFRFQTAADGSAVIEDEF
jgi:hypothetical protein